MVLHNLTMTNTISQLGTILSVWAHPDDESFFCAGLMAMAAGNGQRVVCLTATKGEKGVQDEARWPAARLGEIREAEMAAALDILGLKEHHWLGFADGELAEIPVKEGAARIASYIQTVRPQTILTFPPDGITGHTDHKAVSRWIDAATRASGQTGISVYHAVNTREYYEEFLEEADKKLNFYFNVDQPNLVACSNCDVCLDLQGEVLQKKLSALKAMPSQTEGMFSQFSEEWAKGAFACEAFVRNIT